MNIIFFVHAFGQRYDLPIPLLVLVLFSFVLVLRRPVMARAQPLVTEKTATAASLGTACISVVESCLGSTA